MRYTRIRYKRYVLFVKKNVSTINAGNSWPYAQVDVEWTNYFRSVNNVYLLTDSYWRMGEGGEEKKIEMHILDGARVCHSAHLEE